MRESSTWSDWMKTNQSREGHIETRFQSVCVASVEGMHQMKSRLKTKIRFCPANSNHCSGDSELEKGKYELTNHLPKDAAHVDRVIEKYCKKVGYMNVNEISNRIDQYSGNDVFTEKLIKYGRRFGLAKRGNGKRVNDFSGGKRAPSGIKPEIYKIDPKDGTAVASQQRGLTHSSVFQGFCGCRDMGNLRMCYRCKQNPIKRSTKALKIAQKKKNKVASNKEIVAKKNSNKQNSKKNNNQANNGNNQKKSIKDTRQRSPPGNIKRNPSNLRSRETGNNNNKRGVAKTQAAKKNVENAKKQEMRNHRKRLREMRRQQQRQQRLQENPNNNKQVRNPQLSINRQSVRQPQKSAVQRQG